jgi:hypothetical protein
LDPTTGFLSTLAMTLVFLGCAVVTGYRARRALHLTSVGGAVAMLAATIHFALELGELYDLESAGVITPIHLTMAKVNTAAYLLPVVTGLRTLRDPAGRKLHGRVAWAVLVMTVLTSATGGLMLLWAERLPAAGL